MAYAFDLGDASLQASLRRIAQEELEAALDSLQKIDRPDAVHSLRKNLKKTRALLRLLRSGFKDQPKENVALRGIAIALSARRDAAVRLATLDRLFPDPPALIQPLRLHLAAATGSPSAETPPGLQEALAATHGRAAKWTLHGRDEAILLAGLADTRRRAVHAAKAARARPRSEVRIHDWRKRVKDHWYQARLFARTWPDLMKPVVDSADRLGEALGDHHDLTLFAAQIAPLPDHIFPPEARGLIAGKIEESLSLIEAKAFPIADRLFAGDPDRMAELWVEWRKVWRRGA